jgi:mannose-6-phosphate isomerase-like protein (cupin superfamily)
MIFKVLLFLGIMLSAASAADPASFLIWPKGVAPGGTPAARVNFTNHSMIISHRDKDGMAEVHEKTVDVMVIQSGEAILVLGGEVIGGKTTSPGEILGTSIQGGVKNLLSPGDIIHVPAGMPHQFFIPPGKQITYFVVKVAQP